MTDILMPALSPTMEEGTLAKWTVKVGDTVKSGDVIAEIETDKATMEVEAVDEGVVGEILVPEGSEGVKVNTPIARLENGEADSPPQSSAAPPTAPPEGEHSTNAAPKSSPSGGGGREAAGGGASAEASAQTSQPARTDETAKPQEGARAARDGSAEETREARLQGGKAEREPAPARTNAPPQSSASRPPPSGQARGQGPSPPGGEQSTRPESFPPGGGGRNAAGGGASRIFASPLARRLAQQKGVDLSALKGSGPHGRIVKADVDAAQPGAKPRPGQAQPASQAAPAEAPRQARSLEQMGIAPGSYDLKPLSGMQKTVARRMTDSFRDVPHFPLTVDIELDALLAARAGLNRRLEKDGVKVSVNDMLIKCAALALKAHPDANASYTPEGIAFHHHADVAVAVAIEGGLITPIVREAEGRGLADIARAMKDLAERARNRKLKPEEYQGGTFSVSNLGMFGIKSFASIINEPQGMILSVGAGEKRPVARSGSGGDALAVATVMTVTLTCDHRVVDGAIGARWLNTFRGFVEDPITMLA